MTPLAERISKSRKKYLKRGKKLAKQMEASYTADEIICAGDWLLEQMTVGELKGEKASPLAGPSESKRPAHESKRKAKQTG